MATRLEEITTRLGYDAADVTKGTMAMLEGQKRAAKDWVNIWQTAKSKRIEIFQAAIKQEESAELASLKRREEAVLRSETNNDRVRQQIRYNRMKAGEAEIAAGSGGYGWRKGKLAPNQSGSTISSQILAYQIGSDISSGNDVEQTAQNSFSTAKTIAISTGVGLIFGSVWKALKKAAKKIIPKALKGAPLAEGSAILGMVTLPLASGAEVIKLEAAQKAAATANLEDISSGVDLAGQTGKFAGRGEALLDDLEAKGAISKSQAKSIRNRLTSGDSRFITQGQRMLLDVQQRDMAASAEKRAQAELKAATAVNYAERAAAGKAKAESEAADALERSKRATDELKNLSDRAADIRTAGSKVDREVPTLQEIAGNQFTRQLNADYGEGGKFDLGAGDGPFAAIAQEALLAQKQQRWDIIHGNAQFDQDGKLIGGEAYKDRQRQIAAENKLAAAGMETPEMQFKKMRENLDDIQKDMREILTKGIPVIDAPGQPTQ